MKNNYLDFKPLTLRIKFIIPLVFSIVITIFLLAVILFYFGSQIQNKSVFQERFTRITSISGDFYKYNIESDAKAIQAIMSSLRVNKEFAAVFSTGDREHILNYVSPLYRELNSDYNITHFYFSDLDRVNIIRAHAPSRFGDTINRITTLNAESSLDISYGVELGKLGTLTLRVVSPWYSNEGEHIGYFELGMELDHIINRLKQVLGFDIELFIQKKYLNEEAWKDGMNVLKRNINWEEFNNLVATKHIIHPVFRSFIQDGNVDNSFHKGAIISYEKEGSTFWLLSVPITDVDDQAIASLLILADTSFETNVAQETILKVSVAILFLVGLLLTLFLRQINKVIIDVSQDEQLLKTMASRDPLTNLFTRRVFNEHLKREILNAEKNNTSFSLALIDMDHFKNVNDTYGHNAGDIVLQKTGQHILSICRETDIACRFGGEEFVILVKSSNTVHIKLLVERIRKKIEDTPFDIGEKDSIYLTVSAGVSYYNKATDDSLGMISAADKALYTAKSNGRNCIRFAQE